MADTRPAPWQLTYREFSARGGYCPSALEAEIEAARGPLHALRLEVEALERDLITVAGPWVKRRVPDLATRRTLLGTLAEHAVRDVKSALRSPRVPATLKADYRTRAKKLRAAVADFDERYCHETLHRRIVQEAYEAGLPIPLPVLAEYPDLANIPAPAAV